VIAKKTPTNQSINQSINQSTNQPTNRRKYEGTLLMHNKGCVIYQLLVEAHLSQVLLEDLAVHVHALLPNIEVPVDFRIYTLSPCAQSPTLSHSSIGKSLERLINSVQTAYCDCAHDHRQPDRTGL